MPDSMLTNLEEALQVIKNWRINQEKIVFTNGCFDILHYGHLHYLKEAKSKGDRLVVGINSDRSVSALKGNTRPIQDNKTRYTMISSLRMVDMVVPFDDLTPIRLVKAIKPDILVKGGDYKLSDIVGADFVNDTGGEVLTIPFVEGYSTSRIIDRILKQ